MEKRLLPVKRVRRTSIPDEVIRQLKSLLDAGHLIPGSRLPGERELAHMMNVSRSSLREGLRVLSLLGIVENRPGSGTYLTTSSEGWSAEPFGILFLLRKNVLFEIFEARKILEGAAASLAAARRSEEDLHSMEEALRNMKDSLSDREAYTRHEHTFHLRIVEAAGNRVVVDLMDRLYGLLNEARTRIYRAYSDRIESYCRQDYRSHEIILDAIKKGDSQKASKAMTDHLQDFEQTLKDEQHTQDKG